VIAESWNFNASLSACLVDSVGSVDRNGLVINVDVELVVEALGWPEKSLGKTDEAKIGNVLMSNKGSSL